MLVKTRKNTSQFFELVKERVLSEPRGMVAAVLVCSLSAPCGALYSIQYTSEFADRAEVAATAGQAAAIPVCSHSIFV